MINSIKKELEDILEGDKYQRRKFNTLIDTICTKYRLYPKLQCLKKGSKKLYTFKISVLLWLKVKASGFMMLDNSIMGLLEAINKGDRPFVGIQFFNDLNKLIELTNTQ